MDVEIDGWKSYKGDICLKSAKKQGNGKIHEYQNYEISAAMSACPKWRVAIDVGAHVGITAYQMAKSFEHVHAFEINPKVYPYLVENLAKHKITNVTTYPVGLGDKEEKVDIITGNKSFSTHVAPESQGKGRIEMRTLDFFNFREVDFIKIDAEGYEPFVALGGLETIKRCKPVIMYECKDHPARYGYHKNSIREILSPLGYRMIRRLGRNEKNAVIGYRPRMAPDV